MNVISVICPPDSQLHLARDRRGLGADKHTLCLERWTIREEAREGFVLCPVCFEKWSGHQPQEKTNGTN